MILTSGGGGGGQRVREPCFFIPNGGANDMPRGGPTTCSIISFFVEMFVGILQACALNWSFVWKYPSLVLQLCDAIRARVGNFFVVINICALSSVCTLYTQLLVNVVLSL